MATKGVDISGNNGSVDFAALKKAGMEFVIIRCGYGGDYSSQDDSQFFSNVKKAKAAGMPYGVYLYSYALTISQAKSEAAHALRLLRQIDKPAYGVWFDMEDADHYKAGNGMPSNNTLVEICLTFMKEMEAAGYYTGLYASLSWMENQLNDPRLDKYDKWVAQWGDHCDYHKPYGLWQYTDKLVIGGKPFDANWAYKDYPALTSGKKKEENDMTKAEVLEIIKQYESEKAKKAASQWAEKPLAYCKEHGLLVGDANGSMRPRSTITRQEVAQVLFNLRGQGKPPHDYAAEAWQKAHVAGIMDGTGAREPLTREQFAAVLDRLGLLDGQGQTAAVPGA